MLTPADALPLAVERAGDADGDRRQCGHSKTAVLSPTSISPQIGRDAVPPYNHRGTVIVASAWLAFYVIAAVIASGN
jgi:hypothetical protein